MTEKGFWKLVNQIQAKNRPKLLAAGIISTKNPKELEEARHKYGDSYEIDNLEDIPKDKISEIGKLIFSKDTSLKAKEMIIMTLAHESSKDALNTLKAYNKRPDKELKHYAQFALEECEWWNE